MSEEIEKRVSALETTMAEVKTEVSNIKVRESETIDRFESHMDKEEKAFSGLYKALRSLESRVAEVVMTGMEEAANIKDAMREEMDIARKAVDMEIRLIKRDFISKQTFYIAFAVGAVVAAIVVFLFSTFSVNKVSENVEEEVRGIVNELVIEIRKGNSRDK